MRTIDKYNNQHDEYLHPLWMGILILFSVIIIIGILCCLRIKCNSQLHILRNRLFRRNNKKNENSSHDEKHSTVSYSYNWPSIYTTPRNQSPKLYTLIKNIRTVNLEKSLPLKRQSINEDEIEREIHVAVENDHSQTSIPPDDNERASEIARKFYASMRNNSQCDNSSSFDSCNNDTSSPSDELVLSTIDPAVNSKRQKHTNSFRTPPFFQSIPDIDELGIGL